MRTHALHITLAASILGLAACGGGEAQRTMPSAFTFPVTIDVNVTEEGGTKAGLARVPVKVDDKVIGYTDKEGQFRAYITEKPGTEVTLSLGELNGWSIESGNGTNTLRVKKGVDGKPNPLPLALSASATNIELEYLVWIKLACPEGQIDANVCTGIPVTLDGTEVARTGADGRAHFSSRAPTNTQHVVALETPKFDSDDEEPAIIKPANPSYTIKLAEGSEVFVLEQTLVDAVALASDEEGGKKTKRRKPKKSTKKRVKKKVKKVKKVKKDTPKKDKPKKDEPISIFD